MGASAKERILVWMKSWRMSLMSIPQAENTEAATGTITLRMLSSLARVGPCMGPPPPKATMAKSRGS